MYASFPQEQDPCQFLNLLAFQHVARMALDPVHRLGAGNNRDGPNRTGHFSSQCRETATGFFKVAQVSLLHG